MRAHLTAVCVMLCLGLAASEYCQPCEGSVVQGSRRGRFTGNYCAQSVKPDGDHLNIIGWIDNGRCDWDDGTSQTWGRINLDDSSCPGGCFPSTPCTGYSDTCEVLTLNTGPICLNLLNSIVVTISPICLTIKAIVGSLLGQLLCNLAGLLDGTLDVIAAAINLILNNCGTGGLLSGFLLR